jgi:hypothetical protein
MADKLGLNTDLMVQRSLKGENDEELTHSLPNLL